MMIIILLRWGYVSSEEGIPKGEWNIKGENPWETDDRIQQLRLRKWQWQWGGAVNMEIAVDDFFVLRL